VDKTYKFILYIVDKKNIKKFKKIGGFEN